MSKKAIVLEPQNIRLSERAAIFFMIFGHIGGFARSNYFDVSVVPLRHKANKVKEKNELPIR